MSGNGRGIDLEENYEKIRKVVSSEYGGAPIETEDLVQQVCKKITKRNRSSSPYDPSRSSISRYVHVVARSVVSSHVRKEAYKRERTFDHVKSDVPESDVKPKKAEKTTACPEGFADFLKDELCWDDTAPRRVYLLMSMGYKRSEIASILKKTPRSISWYRTRLKKLLRKYVANEKMKEVSS